MKQTPQEIMADSIRSTTGAVETIAGGHVGVDAAAAEWVAAGFTPDTAREWWAVGAFDADRAADLRDAGLIPAQCEGYAYAHSNGDMTTDDVVAAYK